MSTISEGLNKHKESLLSEMEAAGQYEACRATLLLLDQLKREFLGQDELADSDRRLAPTLFDLMSACLQQQVGSLSKEKVAASEPIAQYGRISSNAIAVARVQLALAVALVLSIVINATAVSLLLALGIGLICYLVASGRWEHLGKTAALSRRLLRLLGPGETPKASDSLAIEEVKRDHARNVVLTLQETARLADSVLGASRYLLDSRSVPDLRPLPNLSQPVLEFLQDLGEVANTADGDFALMVAQKRLGAVADALGIRMLAYGPDTASHFAVDRVAGRATENPCVTVRPALMRGETCLARGYAKLYE
jgi:hypothetical protein